jgi:hypothetical protein
MFRPKHLLAMAFPEKIGDNDLYLKFGRDIKIVDDLNNVEFFDNLINLG